MNALSRNRFRTVGRMTKKILVTGATGNVGRHVVSQLLADGFEVRALTRDPSRASLPAGVDVRHGDLGQPDTLSPALAGIESVFLFASPGSGQSLVRAASEQGVQRVVFLSSLSVQDDVAEQSNPIAAFHADIEHAIEASDLEWTFVRPGAFAANTLSWAPQIRATGVVRGPYGDATVAPTHERDIAAVAVHALRHDGHHGAKYPLTGPESLTLAEQARIIGEVIGREVRYEELPPDVARAEMVEQMPPFIADTLLRMFGGTVGRPALVLPTVEQITGQPAHTFREWVADRADAFR